MKQVEIRYTFTDPNSPEELERFLRKLAVEKLAAILEAGAPSESSRTADESSP